LSALSHEQFIKWSKVNDIWALVVVQQVVSTPSTIEVLAPIAQGLQDFQDVFLTPTELLPHTDYDHTISLLLGSVPVNSRPYRYSP
jgi:hypothetical protein